jgi:hypothetical protein
MVNQRSTNSNCVHVAYKILNILALKNDLVQYLTLKYYLFAIFFQDFFFFWKDKMSFLKWPLGLLSYLASLSYFKITFKWSVFSFYNSITSILLCFKFSHNQNLFWGKEWGWAPSLFLTYDYLFFSASFIENFILSSMIWNTTLSFNLRIWFCSTDLSAHSWANVRVLFTIL